MTQNVLNSTDINVRIIQAVEYCPLLYKGRATIGERQVVWQQLSEQLQVPESVLKSRWHILCGYYQRSLEKRRSTDSGDDSTGEGGDFRYEREMAFMMPYMHARIAIAAANAARKQQELIAAGNNELTDPEFIITEKDLEIATRMNNNLAEEYIFYDIESLDGELGGPQPEQPQHLYDQQQIHHIDKNAQTIENDDADGSDEQIHSQQETEEMEGINEEVIEEVDESGNIVQDLIIEGEELVNEADDQIVVDEEADEEVLPMDDEIETVVEEIVENTQSLDEMSSTGPAPTNTSEDQLMTQVLNIQGNSSRHIIHFPTTKNGNKYVKFVQEESKPQKTPISTLAILKQHNEQDGNHHYNTQSQQRQQQVIVQSAPTFSQEYAVMPRRPRAVVIKATPRVQVELTDNGAATVIPPNAIEIRQEIVSDIHDSAGNDVTNESCSEQAQKQDKNSINSKSSDSTRDYDSSYNDPNVVTSAATDNDIENNTTKGERSEDTIFGELVSAMLKHMPRERKRAIKKSIMDLLLT